MQRINFKFYGITDRKVVGEQEFLSHLEKAFRSGVRAIQIREKDLQADRLSQWCLDIKRLAKPYQVKILLNDRIDIAMALDLDGVHLTEHSLPPEIARKLLGPKKLIAVSAHGFAGVQRAANNGADFVVLGPVAPSRSKPTENLLIAEEDFRSICSRVSISVFALGGVTENIAKKWMNLGAGGAAGISLLMVPDNLQTRLKTLESAIGSL